MSASRRGGLVVGVDSSTQSCTVQIRRDDSTLLGQGRAAHPPTGSPTSEQSPETWWKAFEVAFAAATTDALVQPQEVASISVGAQCHGLVMLDESDQVLRPAKLWNDTTSAPHAQQMVEELGMGAWAHAVGLVPSAAITITKLAWVAEHEPAMLDRLRHVVLPHDWLTFRLTGRLVTDRSEASGTGYFCAATGQWRHDLLRRFVRADLDWETMVPAVLGPQESAGTVQPDVARALGLREDVLVGAGGGDQHLAAVGVGLGSSDIVYSLGTSGVVFASSPEPVADESGWIDGVADATGNFLPLICTLNAMKVTDTFARLLGVNVRQLDELALAADHTERRPVLLAYLDGERTPKRPLATGKLDGLTSATTREALALSAFEGVVYGLVRGHRALNESGIATDAEIIAVGGGSRSPAYRQVLADVLGRAVTTRDALEATARGACAQAAAILDGATVAEVRDAWSPPVTSTTPPRPGAHAGMSDAYMALDDAG